MGRNEVSSPSGEVTVVLLWQFYVLYTKLPPTLTEPIFLLTHEKLHQVFLELGRHR